MTLKNLPPQFRDCWQAYSGHATEGNQIRRMVCGGGERSASQVKVAEGDVFVTLSGTTVPITALCEIADAVTGNSAGALGAA
jgi:hypothetical protein